LKNTPADLNTEFQDLKAVYLQRKKTDEYIEKRMKKYEIHKNSVIQLTDQAYESWALKKEKR
jgi:hypothetical protein